MKKLLLLLLVGFYAHGQLPVEGFEGPWLPQGWTYYGIADSNVFWTQSLAGDPTAPPYQGNHAAFLDKEFTAPGYGRDWLVTPPTLVPENPQVRFFSRLTIADDQNTIYKLLLLTAGGDPSDPDDYVVLQEWSELELNPQQTAYTEKIVNIPSSYVGTTARFAFFMHGNNGDRWLIDNVQIVSQCLAPANLTATNIAFTSAALAWTENGTATQWEVEFLPLNATPTGVGSISTTIPYYVQGLLPAECYKYYVRSHCSPVNTSTWSGPYTFCTASCEASEQCTYTFNLIDTGGNGWSGNSMTVTQNGIQVALLTLGSGAVGSISVPLCHNTPFELSWNTGGDNANEVGVWIMNPYFQSIYSKPAGAGEQGTVLFEGLADCIADDDCIPSGLNAQVMELNALLSWMGTSDVFEYYLVSAGSPAPSAETSGISVNTTSVVATGLQANAGYEFYARGNCMFGFSEWVGPFSFSTGTGNTITGTIKVDANSDTVCDNQDTGLPNVEVVVSLNGVEAYSVYTNAEGAYYANNLPEGVNTITIAPLAPSGYDAIAPVDHVMNGTNDEVSFCVALPANAQSDASIILIPLNNAQPGFTAVYQLIVFNNSPMPLDIDNVAVNFNADRVSLSGVNIPYTLSGNNVTMDFATLAPYTNTSAILSFNVLQPPTNVGGETLQYIATVSTLSTDTNPVNNTQVLNQIIVNSYDPNDITVHEGPYIYEDQADDYLTYTIRFQNTGTADAIHIRLENTLDQQLDWDTFQPLSASHPYYVSRSAGQLEFMFNNIHLPAEEDNEPGSHGFVTYRVKPKSTFGLHDIISNTAEIYFDFNPAIITNTATTEVITTMGITDFEVNNITIYPNPVHDRLTIVSNDGDVLSVQVYDINGREFKLQINSNNIDASALASGMYLLKVTTTKGSTVCRIIKK